MTNISRTDVAYVDKHATKPVIVEPVFGNCGETDGSLTLLAIVDPRPQYPASGRIILAWPDSFVADEHAINMSPDVAMRLAAQLVVLANRCVAACPQSSDDAASFPLYIATAWRR